MKFDTLCRVEKKAENTNASQDISTINLCENSQISSTPILEIENQKVICSHKCKIENIDGEKLFYLNSRGINKTKFIEIYKKNFLENFF